MILYVKSLVIDFLDALNIMNTPHLNGGHSPSVLYGRDSLAPTFFGVL